MSEVDRDAGIPVIGHESAEHQREVRNGQAGSGVPHGRADQNLHVDEGGRGRGDTPQRPVVDGVVCREVQDGDVKRAIATVKTEEDFGEAGVSGRDRRRQEEEHRQPAEHTLQDDGSERRHAEPLRIQRRESACQSQTASTMVRKPTVLAISR